MKVVHLAPVLTGALVTAVLAATCLTPAAASAAPATTSVPVAAAGQRDDDAARATASYAALQTYLGVRDGSGLFHEQYPVAAGDNAYSYEWPYSQVHAATLDLVGVPGARGRSYLPDLHARAVSQEHYWNAAGGTTGLPGYASAPMPPYAAGGDFFYDDNEWVGLEDMQKFLTLGDREALGKASKIFDLVVSGWDTNADHAAPGGVFWTQATWSQDRNTVSNMPGAELGLRLYQVTHQRKYLDWSLRMYAWTNAHLQRPDGLYSDHLNLTGAVEPTVWSYNQGVPVGVNVLLYEVTRDRTYLAEANRIAAAAYDHFVTGGALAGQPAPFNAIFFKNLLLLESVTGGSRYHAAMAAYADDVWQQHRQASTGLFTFGTGGSTQVIDQAAMVQIYAVLAWPRSQYGTLY